MGAAAFHMARLIMKRNVVIQKRHRRGSGAEVVGIPQRAQGPERMADGNPNSATAAVRTLTAVTFPVPNRVFSRSLFRLETIVPGRHNHK